MEQNSNLVKWAVPIIVLVAGLGAGYYFGYISSAASRVLNKGFLASIVDFMGAR
jgi:hypothetical protein